MNISMSEIAQLLPSSAEPKQMEKAEILEKTIIYIKKLQEITGKQDQGSESKIDDRQLPNQGSQEVTTTDDKVTSEQDEVTPNYCSGFRDCIKEVFHCLTNVEAMDLQQSCFRRLMVHLQHELQLISGNVERSKLDSNNHKTVQGKNHHIPYNGGGDKLSSLKLPSHALSCKRSHETSNSVAEPCSSENLMSKRMRQEISFGKNGSGHCPRPQGVENSFGQFPNENGDRPRCSSLQESAISRKEKPKASDGVENAWVRNDSPYSQLESYASERKDGVSNGNVSERPDTDGSRSENDSSNGNHKLFGGGQDLPLLATPISPRTPYVPSPYTVATYALHPSGTHYLPVVLQLPVVPPFAEMKGRLNSTPNGSVAAMNGMRMGNLQYPYFPYGIPLAPQVAGNMMAMNNLRSTLCKQEPESQKRCDVKPKEMESSCNDDENASVNVCSSTEKLF